MAKNKKDRTHFVCQNCGHDSVKWQGKCPSCNAWNSFVEERVQAVSEMTEISNVIEHKSPQTLSTIITDDAPRLLTSSSEFNRVLGGGLVPGSVVLLGGDPGIGKSTLLLQEAVHFTKPDFSVLYITGEESTRQIKMRANRLNINSDNLYILAETELEASITAIEKIKPSLVIIDSIQTVYTNYLDSAPGSISQVRECALRFIKVAKSNTIPIILVGHVTKEGFLAGPKVLEHMVDALLLFEGDRDHFYRILRSAKNRFGSTREIGVFEMIEKGLMDVVNPSAVFLSERRADTSGSTVICCMEGTRPILVEVQALITPANYGMPQRTTTGLDYKRTGMLLAVLEKRLGYRIKNMDVYVNAVGGMRIDETSADLGVLACMASNISNKVVDSQALLLGEVGLGGELRSVSHIEARLAEAEKMGFLYAIIPASNKKSISKSFDIDIRTAKTAQEALSQILS